MQEIHKLVYFQQGDERVEQPSQIPVHQLHQGSTPCRHLRNLSAMRHPIRYRSPLGLIDVNLHIVQWTQRRFNARLHLGPFQAAEAAAQRWKGDRTDAFVTNDFRERRQTCLYVFDTALAPPMPLGRKVDDVARRRELPGPEYEHPSWLHFAALACRRIGLEVLWKCVFELQCDTAPHHAYAIDGIDERFRLALQNIATSEFDHS